MDRLAVHEQTTARNDGIGGATDVPRRQGWSTRIAFPLSVFAVSRVTGVFALEVASYLKGAGTRSLLTAWDGGWYKIIAETGYPRSVPLQPNGKAMQSALAFFPAFPMSIRYVSRWLGVSTEAAGLGIVWICAAAASVLFFELARGHFGDETARRATVLWLFFPGSFVFSILYTEAMSLLAACACLLLLQKRRWMAAGLAAALGTATRSNGVALVMCCAFAAFQSIRKDRDWRSLLAVLLAPLGTIAFFAVIGRQVGAYGFWHRVESEGWSVKTDFGVGTVLKFFNLRNDYGGDRLQIVTSVGLVLVVVGLVWFLRDGLPGIVVIYTLVTLFLPLSTSQLGARPRFILAAFPLFMSAAKRIRGHTFSVVVALSGAGLVTFTAMSMVPFVFEP
jgi:4-amino-4-deoxy-L-arabinose transferase-like glycosyltransferase